LGEAAGVLRLETAKIFFAHFGNCSLVNQQEFSLLKGKTMSRSGVYDEKEAQQEIRIKQMQDKLNELAGGLFSIKTSPDLSADMVESYLEDIINFESVDSGISLFDGLQQHGVHLPPPEELNDFLSVRKVREILRALEKLQIFLIGYEEMTARELYSTLWHQTLWEGCYIKKRYPGAMTLIDVSHKMMQSDIQQCLDELMKVRRIH
jgi:hypothetical protein